MRNQLTIDGMPVVDAEDVLVLEVIKKDIDMRRRRDPECCALAEACKRSLGVTRVIVHRSVMYVSQGDHWVRYWLTEAARSEIQTFDRGGGFSLGSYKVRPPRHLDQMAERRRAAARSRAKKPQAARAEPLQRAQRVLEGVRQYSPLYGGANEPPLKYR